MDIVAALSGTFDHMHSVAEGVRSDQLGNPTPCSEWDVRALLSHAFGVVNGIGAAAAGTAPGEFSLDEENLPGQFRRIADGTLAAWQAPGVLERPMNGGAGEMPGGQYAAINLLDTLVHSWDLARATGQNENLPDAIAAQCLGICEGFITPEVRQFAGFDAAVETAPGASATERLVAFLGRRP